MRELFSHSKTIIALGIGLMLLQSNTGLAQSSTSHSPYSQFGIGQIREDLLPQTRAMGGVSTGVRYQGGLPILNISNPASYSALNRTILDAGLYGNLTQLEKSGSVGNTADFAFSHFAFGFSLNKSNGPKIGGVSFGLLPYSDVGYSTAATRQIDNISYKTSLVGEGGINKAYVGYGVSPFKGFSIGANVGFLFGNLYDKSMIEFPYEAGMYNTVQTLTRETRGATVDYGVQYFKSLGNQWNITFGYSGSLNNAVRSKTSSLVTLTQTDPGSENVEQVAQDTSAFDLLSNRKFNLPLKHNVGITLSKGINWSIGADFKYADWSNFQTREGEQKLGKNLGFAIGGQFKPDATSNKYLNVVDYRLGFRYNKSHITINNHRLSDMAVTVGLGLPLPETNFGRTFSNINISAEVGQLGTMNHNLVRERYINLNLGFTINDAWFIRRSYD
ncbi:hypothetical protein ACFRAE_13805 [Sphingobacterium sp. HJSM2_6]|uniref:hypothetical protein n=1 Tax=Sphingobacterium sp. HJSM2_6 TaxID=3366264 RepID=UPI003BDD1B5B